MFSAKIAEHRPESSTKALNDDSSSESDGENTKDANDNMTEKVAMVYNGTDKISADCDKILTFFQAVSVKGPRIAATPLSLSADKRAQAWLCRWL